MAFFVRTSLYMVRRVGCALYSDNSASILVFRWLSLRTVTVLAVMEGSRSRRASKNKNRPLLQVTGSYSFDASSSRPTILLRSSMRLSDSNMGK